MGVIEDTWVLEIETKPSLGSNHRHPLTYRAAWLGDGPVPPSSANEIPNQYFSAKTPCSSDARTQSGSASWAPRSTLDASFTCLPGGSGLASGSCPKLRRDTVGPSVRASSAAPPLESPRCSRTRFTRRQPLSTSTKQFRPDVRRTWMSNERSRRPKKDSGLEQA